LKMGDVSPNALSKRRFNNATSRVKEKMNHIKPTALSLA
jgi:hypothetical protein